MARRKCSAKQLAALKRGREKLRHKRSKRRTNIDWGALKSKFQDAKKYISPALSMVQGAYSLAGAMGDSNAQKKGQTMAFLRGMAKV